MKSLVVILLLSISGLTSCVSSKITTEDPYCPTYYPVCYSDKIGAMIHNRSDLYLDRGFPNKPFEYTDFSDSFLPIQTEYSQTQAVLLFWFMQEKDMKLTKSGINVIGTNTDTSVTLTFNEKRKEWWITMVPNKQLQILVQKKNIRRCTFKGATD